MERLNRLDHLRFYGAAVVALWHFSPISSTVQPESRALSFIQQGHTGVSLFCVCSGFIFTWLYANRSFSIGEFALKRAARLLPLLIFCAMLTLVSTGLDVGKFLLALATTTIVPGSMTGYVGVGWSVLVEIQFYAMFPFLIWATGRYGPRYLIFLWLFLIVVRATLFSQFGTMQITAYTTMIGRFDQFAAGMLSAYLLLNYRPMTSRLRTAFVAYGAVGLVALIFAFSWYNRALGGFYGPASMTSWTWIILPTVEAFCYSAIIIGYLALPELPGAFFRWVNRAFAFFGEISYSIYLMQFFVFVLVARALPYAPKFNYFDGKWENTTATFLLVALPILLAFSAVTYFLIERPMIDFGNSLFQKPRLAPIQQDDTRSPARLRPLIATTDAAE